MKMRGITRFLAMAGMAGGMLMAAPAAAMDCSWRDSRVPWSGDVDVVGSYEEGIRAYNCGDYERAARRFAQVLRFLPSDPQANYYMGISQAALGKERAALRYLERAVEAQPNMIEAREQLALAYLRAGNNARAAEQLTVMRDLQAQCGAGDCGDMVRILDQAVASVEAAMRGAS